MEGYKRLAGLTPEQRRLLRRQIAVDGRSGLAAPATRLGSPAADQQDGERAVGPLSFHQEQLWILDQLTPGNVAYNVPLVLHLQGALDVAMLQHCLNDIVGRHAALRTTFDQDGGQLVQRVAPQLTLSLVLTDLSDRSPEHQAEEVARCREAEASRPFDLRRGPLIRGRLLRLDEAEHVLLLTIHHIVFDGWSLDLLLDDLRESYRRARAGQPAPLPDGSLRYVDYARWQRAQIDGPAGERLRTYWARRLTGAPTVLPLPTDRPRPPEQRFSGARHTTLLGDEAAAAGLRDLCLRERVTGFMALVSAFAVLLARYTEQEDLLIGTPVACRQYPGADALIGNFINTMVLRVDVSGDPTFRELLARARAGCLESFAHQEYPFERVVADVRPARELSHTPLVQVMFTMLPARAESRQMGDVTLRVLESGAGAAKFDLALTCEERGDVLIAAFEYDSDLFDAATIERMAGHLSRLLAAAIRDPEARVSEFPLLSAEEERELRVAGRGPTGAADAGQATVVTLVEEQAARTPDAVALECEGRTLTYAELTRRAARLARLLRRRGVGPEDLVGVYLDRSPDLVITLLGILKAGAAYVPLDPTYPPDRLAFMIEDARMSLLVTTRALRQRLPARSSVAAVLLDAPDAAPGSDRRTATSPSPTCGPDHLAYVIYTSGSTGRPKGVMISHAALVNLLLAMRDRPGLSADDNLVAVTPYSFDIAALELFLPLVVGARLVIAPWDVTVDPYRLAELLAASSATVMQATPATWRALVTAGWTGQRLRMWCGGEALPPDLARQLLERGEELWNLYGPTETTIWSAAWRVRAEDRSVPLGRPIAETTFAVLDGRLRPVPMGVPGELYIGGHGVARGYWGRPALTAERFLPDAQRPTAGARLYRTGDLVRWRPDGVLEFLGRLDSQVKVRGFRIELGEIEATLAGHPDVRAAVVAARDDGAGGRHLVAYIAAHEGRAPSRASLRECVEQRLPVHMVPSDWVEVDTFPLTPSGKVDRKALLDAMRGQMADAEVEGSFVPAATLRERQLVRIWEDILGRRPIGVTDDFFALGGHSLQAVQLLAHIHRTLGVRIPLAALLRDGTIRAQAALLTERLAPAAWSPAVPLQVAGAHPPLFAIHPASGRVLCYLNLARVLGHGRPVYGLQAPGIEGEQAPETTFEALGLRYVDAIRAVQPEGPYLLAGYSAGGTLAYEVAQQLLRAGEHVALLALFDAANEQALRREVPDERSYWEWYLTQKIGDADATALHELRGLDPEAQLDYVCERLIATERLPITFTPETARDLLRVERANTLAMFRYTPQPYPDHLTLFRALVDRTDDGDLSPALGWQHVARGGIQLHDIDADHDNILRGEHVEAVAQLLNEDIRLALAEEAPAPGAETVQS